MTLPAWVTPILIGIDVLIFLYGIRMAVIGKKTYGWFLALAFLLFCLKEALPYNGMALSTTVALVLTIAGLASALFAFYLIAKSLPS
ncbi:hypothetical protein Mboo_2195 [Methanoregula boonei 6A8]|jgi:hypothetical protein|uniref:Uncharacterized protein n=1 Tax=Methanoregula boonei (strain DSM 21154 / JCM 14090 / 6A8) TaxID=456442 RepID=A7IAE8_METB6|nr:hypothetical protein [Methanoregula boonei]ABS56709.1 hypothetical protein Mboo_2195 [Methanoregula boonei 6A8]